MVEVNLERAAVRVGEKLEGHLIWYSLGQDVMPKMATVSLRWYTEGRGTRNHGNGAKCILESEQLISSQDVPVEFSLEIPEAGPITYDGSLIRVMWELEVVIKMTDSLKTDDKQAYPFQVIPC
jgi:hypothetical protein